MMDKPSEIEQEFCEELKILAGRVNVTSNCASVHSFSNTNENTSKRLLAFANSAIMFAGQLDQRFSVRRKIFEDWEEFCQECFLDDDATQKEIEESCLKMLQHHLENNVSCGYEIVEER